MRRPLNDERGFSLVEVLVAVAVLSIAVVGGFRVLNQGLLSAGSDRDRLVAALVAQNRAEELRLGLTDLPDQVDLAGRAWRIDTERTSTSGGFVEVRIRASTPDAGAEVTAWLPAVAQ